MQQKVLVLLVLLVALSPGLSYAQDYRATVQGLITDSSQAVIVGATVKLHNDGTGVDAAKQTNETGRYMFNLVEPGTYTLTVEQAGFGRFVQQGIIVQVRGDVTVNAALNPGAVAETVSVSANVEAVQFNTATMDLTIDHKQLEDLPILGRNPFSLAYLDPAVINSYGPNPPPYYMWAASSLQIGGHTYRSNDILLDGVSIQLSTKGSYSPPMDAVQEFAVETNSVDAEFGHTAGGILSLGMKSGTNGFHGTASFYGRNPALNAVTSPITRTPSLVKNNIWSGTLGAPIKKNKLFNFVSYEQWRQSTPSYMAATLPSDAMKTGDFSQAKNLAGGLLTIYDPWSTKTAADGTVTRTPFPGNVIPADRIDSAGQAVMNDLWKPNNAGDDVMGLNNFKINFPVLTHYWNFSDRADYYATDKLRTFVRYSMFHTIIDQGNIVASPAVPNGSGGAMHSKNIAADTVYTLNANTVLDFRFGYAHLQDDYANATGNIGASGLSKIWGNNNWYEPYTKNLALILYPGINLNGTGGASTNLGSQYQWYQRPSHYTYSGKLAKQQGIHSWKVGIQGQWDTAYWSAPDTGNFTFNPNLTANTYQNPDTRYSGSQFASLLLGSTGGDLGSYANWSPALNERGHYWSAYGQDDIKLTRRLTVNIGLRWEYETALRDTNYMFYRTVDMKTPIPEMQQNPPVLPAAATALRSSAPVWAGGWQFTSPDHPYQFDVPKFSLMPKFGVAYRLSERSVLRAGFSRNVVPTQAVSGELGWIYLPGYGATVQGAPSLQGIPGQKFSDPYPATNPLILPTGNALGIYTNLGNTWNMTNVDKLVPQVNDRYNISYQRELPGHFTFDGTFFLQATRNKPSSINRNMLDPNLTYTYKSALDAAVPNPFYNYLTPDKYPGSLRYQPTVALSQLLLPEPAFGELDFQNVGDRHEFYKAFELRAKRSFSNGASFLFTYYYSKNREDHFFNALDQYVNHYTSITAFDNRHRITAAGTYELPFGKGRKMLTNAGPLADGVLGGWSVSSIFTFHSGAFLNFSGVPAIVSGDPGSGTGDWKHWFNTSVFSPPAAYTPRTNPWLYEGLTGPRFWNIDSTLAKTFRLTERFNLKFKLEAYNTTNSFMPSDPSTSIYSGAFGVAGLSQASGNQGRTVQYGLQLLF